MTQSLPGGVSGKGHCGLTAYNKAAVSQTHQNLTHCQVTAYKELLPLQAKPEALDAISRMLWAKVLCCTLLQVAAEDVSEVARLAKEIAAAEKELLPLQKKLAPLQAKTEALDAKIENAGGTPLKKAKEAVSSLQEVRPASWHMHHSLDLYLVRM